LISTAFFFCSQKVIKDETHEIIMKPKKNNISIHQQVESMIPKQITISLNNTHLFILIFKVTELD